ncbi:uncharacterized protein GGS22DRAFT_55924 [Annulohypoxylon maeteangense]|uniref:uncharacterized protein n=1 Tax=Annulohypoxylon maeteangense TaxID=1927788 RepID=UPI002008BF0B|nr:uncharacterized protein GGS22DRAFT_55924 [Annulohypoxylon maeteangense]KAI0881755.1 hypothetical protein GGS22DRAFT_55924 [Annulohypoxylon maeteangense]
MDNTYFSGPYIDYSDQNYWLTSTAMARDTSHDSSYSTYSESSNGQYDVALSPASEGINNYDLLNVADAGAYIAADTQEYNTNNQVEGSVFEYQFYDFDIGGDSGQGPHWKLKSQYTPSENYPAIIPFDSIPEVPPFANDASGRHVCLEPYCNATPFKRKADLQRHYLHRHRNANQKKPFPCDWKKCQRSKEPFYRLDHCREHYRDFHMEDLIPRGSSKEATEWWNSRNVDPKWWRCAKCLSRIPIDSKRFECANCKTTCEPERRKLRGYK